MLHEFHRNLHTLLEILRKKYGIQEITPTNLTRVRKIIQTDPDVRNTIPPEHRGALERAFHKRPPVLQHEVSRALLEYVGADMWTHESVERLNKLTEKYSYQALAEIIGERLGKRISKQSIRQIIHEVRRDGVSMIKRRNVHDLPLATILVMQHMHPELTAGIQPQPAQNTSDSVPRKSLPVQKARVRRYYINRILKEYGVPIKYVHRDPELLSTLENDPRVTKHSLKNLRNVVEMNRKIEDVCRKLNVPSDDFLFDRVRTVDLHDALAKRIAEIARRHRIDPEKLALTLQELGFAPREINRVKLYLH